MLSNVIYAVAAVEALLAILGWFWKPKQRRTERTLSLIALLLSIVSTATAQYTTAALIIIGCTLFLLLTVFVLKSSLAAYLRFDRHVTQAYVLLDGITKAELSEIAKKTLVAKGISAELTAHGLEDLARRGEEPRNLRNVLEAAGTVSVALRADFRLCIDLLITLKRFFEFGGEFMEVADKVTVAAKNGVQPNELCAALTAFQKVRAVGKPLKLDEFIAAIVTLKRREQDVELSGTGLGAAINELLTATGGKSQSPASSRSYAKQMLAATDVLDESNSTLTKRSIELQTEIARRAIEGERFLATDDPLLSAMREALLNSESALKTALKIAESAKPPEDLVNMHHKLVAALRQQYQGTQRARQGVEECDFGSVSEGLESRGKGVNEMLRCAQSLQRSAREGRH